MVAVLLIAGDHEPFTPLSEVVGNAAIVAPAQMAATGLNVGMMGGFTTIVSVVPAAHCPASGVKVYVVVAVLLIAGDHVPVIPFRELPGSGAILLPAQAGATAAKPGITAAFTVIVKEAVPAH